MREIVPLARRQHRRDLARYHTFGEEVVECAGQLGADDFAEVAGQHDGLVHGRGGVGRADLPVELHDQRVLNQRAARAVAVNVVILHLLVGEMLHIADEWGLLDELDGRPKGEVGRACVELCQVEVREGQAVLRPRQQTGVHKLLLVDAPRLQQPRQLHPVEMLVLPVDPDDHLAHAVEQQGRRPKHGVEVVLVDEVGDLRGGEVGRLDALAVLGPQVVEHELGEVAVDAAGGLGEPLLRLEPVALGQQLPGVVHLLVQLTRKQLVTPGLHALEDEDRADVVLLELVQLPVDDAVHGRRQAPQGIRKRVFEAAEGPGPVDGVDAHAEPV
mmetsp:Transcript_17009/g.40843  ORF Transcript_17009/g.40843 Transcript_17009/m.40843 type:complete len:329 (+) Transcript_17009:1498-2484(+)